MTGASLLMFPHGFFPKDEKLEGTTRSWQTAAFFSPSPRSIYPHNDKSSEVDAELELNHGQTDKASKLKQLSCSEVTLGPSCSAVPAHSIGFFSPSSLQHAANRHKDMPLPADKQICASDSSAHNHNTDKHLVTALRSVSEEAGYTSSCEVRKGGELPSVQFLEDEGLWQQQDQRGGEGRGSAVSGSDVDEDGPRSAVLEQAKLPSSQYKGVVPQPNGRWGAQIYEKHQRVWLGTFNMEEDAAKAYDRAALKFRGRDAMTNFKHAGEEDIETIFLDAHTKEQVVDMLRRHTYDEELDQSRKLAAAMAGDARASGGRYGDGFCKEAATKRGEAAGEGRDIAMGRRIQRELLFEKAVTPSDVGKLNRLVIPKQHAERWFPLNGDGSEKGLLLNFEDSAGKMWRFRYSYWNSSQSYVLTKGWSRFVKEMKLDAGDIVVFEKGSSSNEEHFYISCRRRPSVQRALLHATLLQQQPSFLNFTPMSASSSSSPYNTIAAAAARFPPQWRLPNHRPSWLIHEEMNPGSAVNTVLFPHPNPSPAPSWIHDRPSIQQELFVNMRAGFSNTEASDQHTSVERPAFAVARVEASDQHTAMRSLASMVNTEARRNKIHGVRLFGVNLSPFEGGGEEPTTMEERKTNSSSMLSCSEAAHGCKDLKRKENFESSDDSNTNKSSKKFRDGKD